MEEIKKIIFVRDLQVLTAVTVNTIVFLAVTPCSLMDRSGCFDRMCCLRFQSRRDRFVGSHVGHCEYYCLSGCHAVQSDGPIKMFRPNVLPPFSWELVSRLQPYLTT
jgi:hypothetical protein